MKTNSNVSLHLPARFIFVPDIAAFFEVSISRARLDILFPDDPDSIRSNFGGRWTSLYPTNASIGDRTQRTHYDAKSVSTFLTESGHRP